MSENTFKQERHLDSLNQGGEVVAYCRGPHCVLAYDAVSRLRAKGTRARRLDGGLPEWRLSGLPVERRSPHRRWPFAGLAGGPGRRPA